MNKIIIPSVFQQNNKCIVFVLIDLKINGAKVAAGSDDGAVIVWCYPGQGKQIFQRKGRSNFPLIVWNPFNRDVLASYNNGVSGRF